MFLPAEQQEGSVVSDREVEAQMQQVRAELVHGTQNVFSITCSTPFLSFTLYGQNADFLKFPQCTRCPGPLFALNETTHG